MQGLVDYGSSDDSDAGDAPVPAPAPAPAPPPADAYGESESESEDEGPAAKKAPTSGLPSAADLLDGASGSTAWLKKPDWARARPAEIQPKQPKPPPAPAPTPLEAEKGDDMYLNYDPRKGWIGKQKTNIDDNHTGYGGAGVRGRDRRAPRDEAPARGQPRQQQQSGKRDKPGKLTGKEKVKQQRLNGQSGIGDHFRVWRSEEEMRMRQQFD